MKSNKDVTWKRRRFLLWLFGILMCLMMADYSASNSFRELREIKGSNITSYDDPQVKLHLKTNQVIMENGIVGVTFSRPEGAILGISYNGIDNVLEGRNKHDNRGYFDLVWNVPGKLSNFLGIHGSRFSVIEESENEVEVSFSRRWEKDRSSDVPLNIDKRYVLRRGSSGIYMYVIMERSEGFPALEIDHIRMVFKLQEDRFQYMAIADDRQRVMPTAQDRLIGQTLDYAEAVLITHPTNPLLLQPPGPGGEVDDKYQYSSENKDNKLHGWINFDSNSNHSLGFWMITPSNEFLSFGPTKQTLTSHVGPTTLNILHTTHYAGKEVTMAFKEGEAFNKVYGPVFVYLNSVSGHHNSQPQPLWTDAKQQLSEEIKCWPYDFPKSDDYFPRHKRGTLEGQLLIHDRYINGMEFLYGENAYVGLALPGDVASWQRQSKGYQFWTKADNQGQFRIENIVPGDYDLYAWVPGVFGDYKHETTITITPGCNIQLGSLIYSPPRNGRTLWEIGIPDRSAAEFYVPDPYPNLINRLYIGKPKHKFRQYGLWQRYSELYPDEDLVYNVGSSDYRKHWFYAQVTRNTGNETFRATTWRIRFYLPFVERGSYTLQLALASASYSNLGVRVNNPGVIPAHFYTGSIGEDNSIARHGIHGLHRAYSIEVPSHLLLTGINTIYLRQAKALSPFQGVMYDYIRLETPPATSTSSFHPPKQITHSISLYS